MKKMYVSVITILLAVISLCLCVQNNKVMAYSEFNNISAKSYVVVDQSGKVLVENNAEDRREVASICKLMTTLITLEKIDSGKLNLSDKFIASEYASSAEGSQAFLDAGSEYKIDDLIKSVIVASANDSAIVLAEGIAGSEAAFVSLMNDKANELGMRSTRYANSTGLPALEQYSTALDTSILLNVVSDYPLYQKYCKIWIDELVHPSGRKTELVNTNRLIKYYDYCNTGKTGFTDEAGYCLSSTASKNGLKLTCVVLGADSSAKRFTESIELLNYCFANFKNTQVVFKDKMIDRKISVVSGKSDEIQAYPIKDYYLTTSVNDDVNYDIVYELPNVIEAPVIAKDVVGALNVVVDSEVVATIELVAADDVAKQEFRDVLNKIIDNFDLIS